uniref:Fibronectin type-III domain-containing protein n=1 Tax=Poecilia formosa TaxID=48698 RepID=A0A096M0D2_POEFO
MSVGAPSGNGAVSVTVSSLTAATKYTFTIFAVVGNVRDRGVQFTAATAPPNPTGLVSLNETESSITLQWNRVNNVNSFILQFNGNERRIAAPAGNGPVTHTVSSLSAETKYTFRLFSEFENIRSSGVQLIAGTEIVAKNVFDVKAISQTETSITLQWSRLNNIVSFVIQYDGREMSVGAPSGNGAVSVTVSSLTAATKYTFTIFAVVGNVRDRGVQFTAATAPPDPTGLVSLNETESSITLQWNRVNNVNSFILQFNGNERRIAAPAGNGPVTHTVSSLSAGTKYTFRLFSEF